MSKRICWAYCCSICTVKQHWVTFISKCGDSIFQISELVLELKKKKKFEAKHIHLYYYNRYWFRAKIYIIF